MKKTKRQFSSLLPSLAFGTAALSATHMLTFVWLTAFVYHDNIRGYVPAGFTGILFLGIAAFILLIALAVIARRNRSNSVPYIAGGCLAPPSALVLVSIYVGVLLKIVGNSWQKDAAINAVGAVFCIVISIACYRTWLKKTADNKGVVLTGDPLRGPPAAHP